MHALTGRYSLVIMLQERTKKLFAKYYFTMHVAASKHLTLAYTWLLGVMRASFFATAVTVVKRSRVHN